jgi:HEAT repeat protein
MTQPATTTPLRATASNLRFSPRLHRIGCDALNRSANPHAGPGLRLALVLLLTAGLAACGRSGVSAADAQRTVDELVVAFRPVDATLTSDVQDRAFLARNALLEKLHSAPPEVGRAALDTLSRSREEALDVQWALLEVAAYAAPAEAGPRLESLILTYDGEKGTGLRTQAVRILSETQPQRAIELLEPLIRDPRPQQTLPPQEELIRGFATAMKKLGTGQARVLCDVVVDLRQPAEARYAAVNALADIGGERAIQALRHVLIEGASDGNLRRKSAQALLRIMPRPELCALIEEAAGHESDEAFIRFLSDMLDKNCAGQ